MVNVYLPKDGYKQAKAEITKLFGKTKPDFPKVTDLHDKLAKTYEKNYKDFQKARDDVEDKILGIENAVSDLSELCRRGAAMFEAFDFSLDPKKPEDLKKIKQVRGIFADWFSNALSAYDEDIKNLDELNKHVIQMKRYQSPKDG